MNRQRGRRRNFQPYNKKDGFKKNYQGNQAKREYRHTEQLTEAEVGINKFVSELEGVPGIIKARFSDFHVNEIDLDGEVAHLTDTSIPTDFQLQPKNSATNPDNGNAESPLPQIPQDVWDKIKVMVDSEAEEVVELEVTAVSKDDRKNIHEAVKNVYGQRIVAKTVAKEEQKFITFKRQCFADKSDQRVCWPKDIGEYVHFIVYKECLDTLTTCFQISEALQMSPSHFTYAGIKDKRAKTSQWFCAKKIPPWKLLKKTCRVKRVRIGNIKFKDTPLKLGDLLGNRFRIALRNVTSDDAIIKAALEHVDKYGFINYYGLQRFGNDKEVSTFSIGVHLLIGKWKEACQLILKPKLSDDPDADISKAKKCYEETGDAEKAYKLLDHNKNNCVESLLLRGLSKGHANEYVNALESIPRNMRLLYIHGFQSLIWNTMVSKRLNQHGFKPVEGDFVVVNNLFVEPEFNEDEENGTKEAESARKNRQQVKALNKSDLEEYSIYDIVLPLPGYDVQYPENMKDHYKEELEKHGLTLEMPKQKVKTYTLSGTYRKVMGRLGDFTWKIMKYNDPNVSLIPSDLEILQKRDQPKIDKDGEFKALVLEFNLDSSSYATMALREIMKTDTSTSAHAKLNDYAEKSKPATKLNNLVQHIEQHETIGSSASSLLNDTKKLEDFKNSIFNFTESEKRKNEDEEDTASKKLKESEN